MFCEKCGMELRAGNDFCPGCGMPVRGRVVKNPDEGNHVTSLKAKKSRRGLSVLVLAVLGIVVFAAFKLYFLPKWERDKVSAAVQECFDALENGDIEKALTYTDYNREISLADYFLSEENNSSRNFVQDTVISFLKTDERWKSVLDYGLSNSVRGYVIKSVRVNGDIATVQLEVESPDFATAAYLSDEMLLELVKKSYRIDEIPEIAASIAAASSMNPAAVANALKEILGPLYSQWPEQIKTNFGEAESRSIEVELRLEKVDRKWLIRSEESFYLIETYISDIFDILLEEL